MIPREKLNVSLGELYDSLFFFESSKNKNASHYPIHKRILIEDSSLLTWLFNHLPLTHGMTVFDAGCGTGHALFRLYEAYQIQGIGLSLSKEEILFAKSIAKKLGAKSLDFHQRDLSMNTDDLGKFDLILAIESLKHTHNPIAIIDRLVDQLTPDGIMVVVDDFLLNEYSDSMIDGHKQYWNAPGFITVRQMKTFLENTNQVQYELVNHSKYIHSKPAWLIFTITQFVRIMRPILPRTSILYRNLTTYLGAVILELLYRKKKVGYFTWIIKINPVPR